MLLKKLCSSHSEYKRPPCINIRLLFGRVRLFSCNTFTVALRDVEGNPVPGVITGPLCDWGSSSLGVGRRADKLALQTNVVKYKKNENRTGT
jgi:hypothetical protein